MLAIQKYGVPNSIRSGINRIPCWRRNPAQQQPAQAIPELPQQPHSPCKKPPLRNAGYHAVLPIHYGYGSVRSIPTFGQVAIFHGRNKSILGVLQKIVSLQKAEKATRPSQQKHTPQRNLQGQHCV